MRKLLLIDGSNLMFRAYYATAYSGNLMQNSKGEYTNAVFALANMLNAIANESFTHVLVAFDKGKETYRHKEFKEYKAKRKAMPDEFRMQLPYIHEITSRLGFFQYEDDNYEADDIIGTLACQYYEAFDVIEIISNDRDLYQLLNDKVIMRISKKGTQPESNYTQKNLYEEYKLKPIQIPDLKGLMGDSSDNIPGIPGIGEKTALKLLEEYHTLENVLANTNEFQGKLKERIRDHQDQATLSKQLATIITDATLPFDLSSIAYQGYDEDALIAFYEKLEFHSFIKRIKSNQKSVIKSTITPLFKEDEIEPLLTNDCVIILESYKENYHQATKLGFALINHYHHGFIPYETALKSHSFKNFLSDKNRLKSTFDLKRLKVCLMQDGLNIEGVTFDLLLAAYVLNPSNTKDDFKVIVQNFDYEDVPYLEEVYGKGAQMAIPEEKYTIDYAMKKAQAVKSLQPKLIQMIEEADQEYLFNQVEMPLAETLALMEYKGIRIDLEALNAFDEILTQEIEILTEEIHQLARETFNIASPKQLGIILFEKLALPSYKKSQTGYSTNIEVLKKLKSKHPIIEKVIRYRSLTKLQSTYVNGLRDTIQADGKIHTIYKQAFTQTGRLSSIEPNLQNIPIRTELGRQIRKVFIPEVNERLMTSDYSQIELRVLADMADEQEMIKAFIKGEDIHTHTAKEIFEKDTITQNDRQIAKAVNFGIIYGQSPWGLSDDLGIPLKEAERFIDRYYQRFFGIASFMDNIIEFAKEEGYVKTKFNRRRYIPEINSRMFNQRELSKRTAMNAPIQGTAADIIKIAMVLIDQEMRRKTLKSTLLLQIHDELVFSVPQSEEEIMKQLVKNVMENAITLKVPLTVHLSFGENLDDVK